MTLAVPVPGLPSSKPSRESGHSRYWIGVVITVAAIFSQYVVPQRVAALHPVYTNFVGSLAIIYGIPIVAFVVLVGWGPIRGWSAQMGRATWEGLRWYGLMSALAILVLFALITVYLVVDRSALDLLSRPNPVLVSARSNPWFWVAFSFAIGGFEELIFRGWIFGYWRGRPGVGWFGPAVGSCALFAGVHLYYGFTYGAAAPLVFPELFLLGFAFAATVQASGGNLVVVALLHGVNDSAAFLTLVSPAGSLLLHYGVIGIGLVIALITFLRSRPAPSPPLPPFFTGAPPFPGSDSPYFFPPPSPPSEASPPPARPRAQEAGFSSEPRLVRPWRRPSFGPRTCLGPSTATSPSIAFR